MTLVGLSMTLLFRVMLSAAKHLSPRGPPGTRGDSCNVCLFCSRSCCCGSCFFLIGSASRHHSLDAEAHEHRRGCGQAHERNQVRVSRTYYCHKQDRCQGRIQQECNCSRLYAQHEDGHRNGRENQAQSHCNHCTGEQSWERRATKISTLERQRQQHDLQQRKEQQHEHTKLRWIIDHRKDLRLAREHYLREEIDDNSDDHSGDKCS